MKNTKLSALFVLFLGLVPLQAMNNGQDEAREEGPSVVAAAAQSKAKPADNPLAVSVATPWQQASSEVCVLTARAFATLKSTDAKDVEKKSALFAKAAQATGLEITQIMFLPGDKETLLSFLLHCKKVDDLSLYGVRMDQLPKLPIPGQLTHLILESVWLQTTEGIADYQNIQHLSLRGLPLIQHAVRGVPKGEPRVWTSTQRLSNLRSLRCDDYYRSIVSNIIQNNPHLERFDYKGGIDIEALSALPSSLRQLKLEKAHLDDKALALLPTDQLEALVLENNTFTSLEPLRNAPVRVLWLTYNHQPLGMIYF